jgi:RNA polymerase sigma factor (sigma-70 family)
MRTNDEWIVDLNSIGHQRELAVKDLRSHLLQGLDRSVSRRSKMYNQIDDVVQDALLKILSSLEQFHGRSRFTTWAMQVTIRTGISAHRRLYHRDSSFDSSPFGSANAVQQPFDRHLLDIEKNELIAILRRLIHERLSSRQRRVVQLILSGLSAEEISVQVGANRNAVYKLLHDGRRKLKSEFERIGISTDDILNL